MLLHARKQTSLLFPAPSPPSLGSRRGGGGTERTAAAPTAAAKGTARVTECRGSAGPPRRGSRPGAQRRPRTPRDVRSPGGARTAAAASPAGFLFLSEVFSPTPLLLLPPPPLPTPCPLPALRPHRGRSRRPAGAGGCRAPRSPRGNFWTRWRCPLG